MDNETFERQIEPFYWVEHRGGCFSLCLTVCVIYQESDYKQDMFLTRQNEDFYGNGYDWASLAMVFIEEKMPEYQKAFDFDPEHSMFCVRSTDRALLEKFALSFKDACENDTEIRGIFSRVEPDYYMTKTMEAYEARRQIAKSPAADQAHSKGKKRLPTR